LLERLQGLDVYARTVGRPFGPFDRVTEGFDAAVEFANSGGVLGPREGLVLEQPPEPFALGEQVREPLLEGASTPGRQPSPLGLVGPFEGGLPHAVLDAVVCLGGTVLHERRQLSPHRRRFLLGWRLRRLARRGADDGNADAGSNGRDGHGHDQEAPLSHDRRFLSSEPV